MRFVERKQFLPGSGPEQIIDCFDDQWGLIDSMTTNEYAMCALNPRQLTERIIRFKKHCAEIERLRTKPPQKLPRAMRYGFRPNKLG